MKVLLLGIGLQGRAVVYDLEKSRIITEIVAADLDPATASKHLAALGCQKTKTVGINVENRGELKRLITETQPALIICMLPPDLGYPTAQAAINAGVPFISTSYTGRLQDLDGKARKRGVTILPEMGLDPGIDLVLCARAITELDEVQGLYSYGAGVPEPSCADDNPLKYKITWTFDGVLNSYKRPAQLLRDGREVHVPARDIFRPENIHLIDIPGIGTMEAYPNGNAIQFIDKFNIRQNLKHMGRFAMRWPGHCRFWQTLVDLGFLDEAPVDIEGARVLPQQFLVAHLGPKLQYRDSERDLVILRIHAWGIKDGRDASVIYELVDYRDLQTGFFAMNRTVGYTASIGAQMILTGKIQAHGVLSPIKDVPAGLLLKELEVRGIRIDKRVDISE